MAVFKSNYEAHATMTGVESENVTFAGIRRRLSVSVNEKDIVVLFSLPPPPLKLRVRQFQVVVAQLETGKQCTKKC